MNLQQLENVENELQFETFTNEDALSLGMTLIDYAKENNKALLREKNINEAKDRSL
ncbi:hypothetical protein [Priestia megaterium]|uniref:hypothetical protein n=1 Tax=Priestia megaterium TaxID=1404 RepID=UPI003A801044